MTNDRTTQYCNDVMDGTIIAGNTVRLACRRHLDDIEKSKTVLFKYEFDLDKANSIINFAETLTLAEGEGQTKLKLYPFQCFILGSLLGWVNKGTGYRRFRQSYIQLARQNGKSMLSGILTAYFGNFVNYNSGLILLAATTKDQAKIVYGEAVKFINSDEDLQELFNIKDYKSEIECNLTHNLIRAIGRDTTTIDGFRAIYGSVDEYHRHKDSQMYALIKDGQKKLKECLINVITTSGFTIGGACHKLYKYCKGVLDGTDINETQFVFISELDEGDDLSDFNNYYKSNPTLQYDNGNEMETMKTDYAQSKKMGGKDWNNFLTKQQNMWVEFTETKYMSTVIFDKGKSDMTLEDFRGQECTYGLDLSSGGDLTSFIAEFTFLEGDEKKYFVHHHSFIPSTRIEQHEKTDSAPYKYWIQQDLVTPTYAAGGIKTDYHTVLKYMKNITKEYDLKPTLICYDQANASAFLGDLDSELGVDTMEIYQTSKSLNDAVMDIKYECEAGNILYNKKDELLVWAMNNCEITKPRNGKVMLDKNSRTKRIDPIAAFVDAHCICMRNIAKRRELTTEYISSFYS